MRWGSLAEPVTQPRAPDQKLPDGVPESCFAGVSLLPPTGQGWIFALGLPVLINVHWFLCVCLSAIQQIQIMVLLCDWHLWYNNKTYIVPQKVHRFVEKQDENQAVPINRGTQDEKESTGQAPNVVLQIREEFSKSTKKWFKFVRWSQSAWDGSPTCFFGENV